MKKGVKISDIAGNKKVLNQDEHSKVFMAKKGDRVRYYREASPVARIPSPAKALGKMASSIARTLKS